MRDFASLFDRYVESSRTSGSAGMVLLSGETILRVYYGTSAQGYYRIAFMSSVQPPDFESTRAIRVSVVKEGEASYWTFLDLVDGAAKAVYFTFCDDLVSVVENTKVKDEHDALVVLKNRYMAWRTMFKQERSSLSDEQIVGLLGELIFLADFMIPRFGASRSIAAWSGIDGLSKDFSIDEKWYEVKTVSLNSNTVKINSVTQLSSSTPGALVIVRYEQMSDSYDGPRCSVVKAFKSIMAQIDEDDTRGVFLTKLIAFGVDVTGTMPSRRYRIADMSLYRVDDGFPRIQEGDIVHKEIDKLTYSLIINCLDQYKFDGGL